jgi:hypothetical protein
MRFPDYDRTLVLPALSPDLQPDSSRTHDCREPAGDPLTGVTPSRTSGATSDGRMAGEHPGEVAGYH